VKDTLRKMLAKLKSSKGCNLYELKDTLPEEYLYLDISTDYLALSEIVTLVKWGLAEAYCQQKLIPPKQLEEVYRNHGPEDLLFFVTQHTFEIEQAFGLKLDGRPSSIFGPPQGGYPWPEIFVLMPFATELKPIYEDHIKKVAAEIQLSSGRADDFFLNGSVITDIWSAINAAKIVIADCTGRNPNVFYEIGVAHAIGKDTILISKSIEDVPFDLRHLRVIIYEYTPPGIKALESTLKNTISNMLKRAT